MKMEDINDEIKMHRNAKNNSWYQRNCFIAYSNNYPYLIVDYCIERNTIICVSNPILQEYIEVLGRPKFSRFTDFHINADFLLAWLSEMAEI
jgi:predicted nucleic acid-binding protein